MGALLEAVGLEKTYPTGRYLLEVLKGVNLSVQAGEFLVIVGRSGAGKSTLLNLLGGLDRPTEGQVRFEGKDLFALADREQAVIRNRAFGFVFQFYHLVPELTALENVALPGWMSHGAGSSPGALKKAQELLEQVGLETRASHRPAELSGGEQQRVAMARALMNDPKIVFCDEPTGNLDSQTGKTILKLLRQFHRQQGTAFVVVTHEPTLTQMAGRVLSLKDGRLWD